MTISLLLVVVFISTVAVANPADDTHDCMTNWCWFPSATERDEYHVIDGSFTQAEALAACRDLGDGVELSMMDPGALDALVKYTNMTEGVWTGLQYAQDGSTISWLPNPQEPVDMTRFIPDTTLDFTGRCLALNTSAVNRHNISLIPCDTELPAYCRRQGAPSSWITVPDMSIEYGLFSLHVLRNDAADVCHSYGGTLAWMSEDASQREAVSAALNASGMFWNVSNQTTNAATTRYWYGLEPTTDRFSRTELGVEFPKVDGATESKTRWAPDGSGDYSECPYIDWSLYPNNGKRIECIALYPFMCSRPAIPTEPTCSDLDAEEGGVLYQYLPSQGAKKTELQNYTTPKTDEEAVTWCGKLAMNFTKFRNTTALMECYGNQTVQMLGSGFRATNTTEGHWQDGSTDPISPIYQATKGSWVEGCWWVNATDSVITKDSLIGGSCDTSIPFICEVNTSSIINITTNNTELDSGWIVSDCPITATIRANRQLVVGQSITICPLPGAPGLGDYNFPCFELKEGDTWASVSITRIKPGNAIALQIPLITTCTPENICSNATSPNIFTVTTKDVTATSPTLKFLGITHSRQGTNTPKVIANASIGSRVDIEIQLPAAVDTGSAWQVAQNVTLELVDLTDAADCEVYPPQIWIEAGKTGTTSVFCEGGSNSTSVTVQIVTSFGSQKNQFSVCSIVGGLQPWPFVQLDFVLNRTISIPTEYNIYGYAIETDINVTISELPAPKLSAMANNTNAYSWLCLVPSFVHLAEFSANWICFFTDSEVGATQSFSKSIKPVPRYLETIFESLPPIMTLTVIGPARRQYNLPATIDVKLQLVKFNLTLSGLPAVGFEGTAFDLVASIPYPIPVGKKKGTTQDYQVDAIIDWNSWILEPPAAQCSGLDDSFSLFRINAGETQTQNPYTPACLGNGTLSMSTQGNLANLFNKYVVNPHARFVPATYMKVVDPPEYLFLNAGPTPLQVLSGSEVIGTGDATLTPNISLTPSPITVSPTNLTWVTGTAQLQTFWITAQNFALDFTVNFEKTGSNPQFLPPSVLQLKIRNQSLVTFEMDAYQHIFINGTYTLWVTVVSLPLTSSHVLQAVVDPLLNGTVTNTSAEFRSTSSLKQPLHFNITKMPINSTSLDLPVVLSDKAAVGYYPPNAYIPLKNLREQLTITISAPDFIQVQDTREGFPVTAEISSPVEVSSEVQITISTGQEGSNNPTMAIVAAQGNQRIWGQGDSGKVTFLLLAGPDVDPNANVTFHVRSIYSSGQESYEVAQVTPAITRIPVRKSSTVAVKMQGVASFGTIVRQERNVSLEFELSDVPANSVLDIRFSGDGTNFVSFDPPFLQFSEFTPKTVLLNLTGTAPTPTGVSQKITFTLSGSAVALYGFAGTSQGTQDFSIFVDPLLELITNDLPNALINGQENVTAPIELPEALPPNTYLTLTLNCTNCDPGQLVIVAVDQNGAELRGSPVLVWNSSTGLKQYVALSATSRKTENAILEGVLGGDATGFAPLRQELNLRDTSPVIITWPTGRFYGGENATIVVNITNPVLFSSKSLTVTPGSEVWNVTVSPVFDLQPKSLNFNSGRSLLHFTMYSDLLIQSPVACTLSLLVDGTAKNEYDYKNPAITQTNGVVVFRPRRKITLSNLPARFYVGELTPIGVGLSEIPDPGTSLVVDYDSTLSGISSPNHGVFWTGTLANQHEAVPQLNFTIKCAAAPENERLEFGLQIKPPPSTTGSQVGRYELPPNIEIVVMEKVKLEIIFNNGINTDQVLGSLNNQTFIVNISRPPLAKLTATPTYTSAVPELLSFWPPTLEWEPLVFNATYNKSQALADYSLSRVVVVTGSTPGPGFNLHFKIAGLSEELAYTESPVFLPTLTITNRHIIYFNTSVEPLYVGKENERPIWVTISASGYKELVLRVGYTLNNTVLITNNNLTFPARTTQLEQSTIIRGLHESFVGGDVTIDIEYGPEFEHVRRIGATNVTEFPVFDLVKAKLDNNTGGFIPENSTVSLVTDATYKWQIQLEGTLDGSNVTYELRFRDDAGEVIRPLNPALPINKDREFFHVSPTQFIFGPQGLHQDFTIFSGGLVPFFVEMYVQEPNVPIVAPGYQVTVLVEPDLLVTVSDFPTELVIGAGNTKTFYVTPSRGPRTGEGSVELKVTTDADCAGIAKVDDNSPALRWPSGNERKPVKLIGLGSGSCQFGIEKAVLNSFRRSVSIYYGLGAVGGKTTDGFLSVVPQPQINWWNPVDNLTRTHTLNLNREMQRGATREVIFVEFGGFNQNLKVGLRNPESPPSIQEKEEASFGVVLITSKSVEEEPQGFYAVLNNPDVLEKKVFFEVITGTGDAFTKAPGVESDEVPTLVRMSIGPFPNLLLLDEETLQIKFTKNAFIGMVSPSANNTISITVPSYVPSIVSASDEEVAQGTMITAFAVGLWFAPPLAVQGSKTYSLLQAFECPSKNWIVRKQKNVGLMQAVTPHEVLFGTVEELGRWMAVAMTNVFFVALFFLIHALIVLGFFVQRRKGSDKKLSDLMGKFRFPSLSFLPLFVLVQPTVECAFRVMLYSPNVGFRVGVFLVVFIPITIFAVGFHGVVWRNESLTFRPFGEATGVKKIIRALKGLFTRVGEWYHPSNSSYVNRFSFLFSEQRDNYRWYFLFEFAAAILLGAASAIEPSQRTGCFAKTITLTVILAGQFVAIVLWRPFRVMFMNVVFGFTYLLQATAMIILTQEMLKKIRNDKLQKIAVRMILSSSIMWTISGVILLIVGLVAYFFRKYDIKTDDYGEDADPDDGPVLYVAEEGKDEMEMGLISGKQGAGQDLGGMQGDEDSDEDDEDPNGVLDLVERVTFRKPMGTFRDERRTDLAFSPLRKRQVADRQAMFDREAKQRPPGYQAPTLPSTQTIQYDEDELLGKPKKTKDPLDELAWIRDSTDRAIAEKIRAQKEQTTSNAAAEKPKLRVNAEEIPEKFDLDEDD